MKPIHIGIAIALLAFSLGYLIGGSVVWAIIMLGIAITVTPSRYDIGVLWKESRQRYMAWYVPIPNGPRIYLGMDLEGHPCRVYNTRDAIKFTTEEDARAFLPKQDDYPHIAGRVGVEIL